MDTRGYRAYRYKGRYYREHMRCDAYPEGYGIGMVESIPRNPAALEKWIAKLSKALLDEKSYRYLGWYPEDICTDSDWTLGDDCFMWTYVIDLDNRVFTVNGVLHFKFDNMPPLRASGSKLGFVDYFEDRTRTPPEIPAEHLTSLEFWPKLNFDAEKAQQEYSALQPTVAILSEWGALTWGTLSVPQRLSVSLIKALVYDYSDELALCSYQSTWDKLGVFCWGIANAAATSHLLCPPTNALPQRNTIYVLNIGYPEYSLTFSPHSTPHYYLQHEPIMSRYYRFRGCLITFCPRLDEPTYMTYKVAQMVQNLRKNHQTRGVGIIISGWHLVAVTVDGSDVRHSPVLELHDGKELKDGALLLIHLLSPTFTRSKTPWLTPIHARPYNNRPNVPDEVLREIIHFTDFNSYIRLSMVSHYFRSIYLAYPRIGKYTLLSYEGLSPNSAPEFRVRRTSSTDSQLAILKRVKSSLPKSQKASLLRRYECDRN
ncbi:hypothetical protein RSAG8_06165, partial [Rhizoctonia solani AG-8 WAC10335]